MPPSMSLLQLEPDTTLTFSRSASTTSPSRMLKLVNLHSTNVAFKVKTTAPKAYLVRPSTGTLRPKEPQEVQIILQPQGMETQANSHRFLVQAIPVGAAEPVTREQWAEFPKEKIQEQRLNVVLEEAPAEPAAAVKSNEASVTQKEASATNTSAGDQPGDLKVKYEELVQYTLMLEKEKKKLEADVSSLQASKSSSSGEGGYSKLQIFLVAVFTSQLGYFLMTYAEKFMA